MEIKKLGKNAQIYQSLSSVMPDIIIIGILLLLALTSYSPEDPNFIFPENTEIKNILGFSWQFYLRSFFSIFWLNRSINPFSSISDRNKYYFK